MTQIEIKRGAPIGLRVVVFALAFLLASLEFILFGAT
ncbi:MAG: hypothetical protein CM15mP49_23720 [Actinomycetota bacterium]|nr:MAG: hypothetical protein CM15mP49_23720 [Actinomycetota bacterium]